MKSNITKITKFILDFMFAAGIVVTISLPWTIKWYGELTYPRLLRHYWQSVFVFGGCGVLSILIIWELRKMFKTVLEEDCFVQANTISLRRMGNYSFLIALIMTIRCFTFVLTISALTVVIVFVVAGLFSKVLAEVFDKAVTYKLENDLTI